MTTQPSAMVAARSTSEDGERKHRFRRKTVAKETDDGFVVADPAMRHVLDIARKLAEVPTTVLLLGETGVGKDVVAGWIHRKSPRGSRPFVRLNCASLPVSLFERELFGHERGAFTGAGRQVIGCFEAARGGTLFLDEIGELPLATQVKLLDVLEKRVVRRLGGTQPVPIDVRVISATHRDLRAEVARACFREDLYYRLSPFTLTVPPLRDRPGDIPLLAAIFAHTSAIEAGRPEPTLDPAVLSALLDHAWPGNVRELKNAIEHAVVLAEEGRIEVEHLPAAVRSGLKAGKS